MNKGIKVTPQEESRQIALPKLGYAFWGPCNFALGDQVGWGSGTLPLLI